MPGYTVNFTTESLAEAHATAARRGTTLARLMHELLNGGPAQIFEDASGGALDVATIRFALDKAEAIVDSPEEWGTAASGWVGKAEHLTRWLKENPYRPDAPERVKEWWDARPACVVEAMHDAVAR
jgi:hypothetical protein